MDHAPQKQVSSDALAILRHLKVVGPQNKTDLKRSFYWTTAEQRDAWMRELCNNNLVIAFQHINTKSRKCMYFKYKQDP